MTSNQLEYWRNKETERANKAKEYENFRHNTAEEAVKQKQLTQSQRELLTKLADMWGKYGWMHMSELPPGLQHEIASEFGFDPEDQDFSGGTASAWDGMLELISSLGGGKGLSAIIA